MYTLTPTYKTFRGAATRALHEARRFRSSSTSTFFVPVALPLPGSHSPVPCFAVVRVTRAELASLP
jgi:hypothetical protein